MTAKLGVVLYVHGARDPRWAEPFLCLRDRIARMAPQCLVAVAFLEHMAPDLTHAVADMAAQGVDRIRVVPMFFGRGAHLRKDFPRQLEAARAEARAVIFEVTESAGESDQVLQALAKFALGVSLPTPKHPS